MLSRVECSDEPLLSVLILNEAFTLTLRDDEEIISRLSLLNLNLLRLTHDKLNLRNNVVFDFRVQGEDQVLLELL